MIDRKMLIVVSFVLAGFFIVAATWFRIDSQKNNVIKPEAPQISNAGSTHRHMAIKVYVPDGQIDFTQPQYQSQSELVHFENDDGTFIHKHATGVTLPYLFETLHMQLTPDCLVTDYGKSYCTDGANKLYIFVNRVERNKDIPYYELQNSDKYLITYGNFSDQDLELQLNSVPDITDELMSY